MTNDTPDLAATIAELERLDREAFRAPWTYSRWEVECEACEAGTNEPETGCPDPDCDGTHAPLTCIESPEEYPGGQVVAQFKVPGLLSLADKNGALIVALRNAAPQLLSAARIAQELTALLHELYPYNGAPSPVAQLKEVIAQSLGYSEAFDRGRALERETTESLRAALAEKDESNKALRVALQHAESRELVALAELDEAKAESARLRERVAELEEQATMACIEPREGCQCAGCLYARDAHAKTETP